MSVETKAALDDAIQAHYADEMDGDLDGYVLQMAGNTITGILDGTTSYYRQTAEGQAFHVSLGLIDYLVKAVNLDFVTSRRPHDDPSN